VQIGIFKYCILIKYTVTTYGDHFENAVDFRDRNIGLQIFEYHKYGVSLVFVCRFI